MARILPRSPPQLHPPHENHGKPRSSDHQSDESSWKHSQRHVPRSNQTTDHIYRDPHANIRLPTLVGQPFHKVQHCKTPTRTQWGPPPYLSCLPNDTHQGSPTHRPHPTHWNHNQEALLRHVSPPTQAPPFLSRSSTHPKTLHPHPSQTPRNKHRLHHQTPFTKPLPPPPHRRTPQCNTHPLTQFPLQRPMGTSKTRPSTNLHHAPS